MRYKYFATLLLLLGMGLVGCGPGTMSQSESDAREALRGDGAITVLDANGIHVATVTLAAPSIKDKMDEAIPHIAELAYVTHLDLSGTNLTDEHMKTVGGLKRLTSLVLSGTQIGDAGLEELSGLKLDTLYVNRTKVGSASMDQLADFSSLKILDISETEAMSNLEGLSKLKSVEWLVLDNSNIDAGTVDALKGLESLGRLSLNGSTISDEDLGRLKSAKPGLMIDGAASQKSADSDEETSFVAPN